MMALNGDRCSTTKNCTFRITALTWTGNMMLPREMVEDPLNPNSIHPGFSSANDGNPIYLNVTICNRSAELPGSTRILFTSKSLIPNVKMRAS